MSTFSIGSMNQLGDALFKAGFWTDGDITQLKQDTLLLQQLREVTRGTAKICYVISGDVDPIVPDGFKLEREFTNNFVWDPKRFKPYVTLLQHSDKLVTGVFLSKSIAGSKPMNATVAEFLLNHQWLIDEIIPEDSEITRILFLGTVYTDSTGMRYVPALEKNPNRLYQQVGQSKWGLAYKWINDSFDEKTAVATLD